MALKALWEASIYETKCAGVVNSNGIKAAKKWWGGDGKVLFDVRDLDALVDQWKKPR